jgi:hypothetical protein
MRKKEKGKKRGMKAIEHSKNPVQTKKERINALLAEPKR